MPHQTSSQPVNRRDPSSGWPPFEGGSDRRLHTGGTGGRPHSIPILDESRACRNVLGPLRPVEGMTNHMHGEEHEERLHARLVEPAGVHGRPGPQAPFKPPKRQRRQVSGMNAPMKIDPESPVERTSPQPRLATGHRSLARTSTLRARELCGQLRHPNVEPAHRRHRSDMRLGCRTDAAAVEGPSTSMPGCLRLGRCRPPPGSQPVPTVPMRWCRAEGW